MHYPHHLDKVMSFLPTLLLCTQREPVARVLNTVAYFHATGAAGTIPAGVLDRFARTVFSFLASPTGHSSASARSRSAPWPRAPAWGSPHGAEDAACAPLRARQSM